jgi:hypothetical protein
MKAADESAIPDRADMKTSSENQQIFSAAEIRLPSRHASAEWMIPNIGWQPIAHD